MEKQADYRTHLRDLKQASDAATLLSEEAFKDMLPGTGSNPWKQLWEYARQYSTTRAYPDVVFPNTDDGAVCILCQQPLDEDAKLRLKKFEVYVSNRCAQQLQACQRVVNTDREELDQLTVYTDSDESIYEELRGHDPALCELVQTFQKEAEAARNAAIQALKSGDWKDVPQVALNDIAIRGIAHILGERAEKLKANLDEAAMERAKARILELQIKEWLSANLAALEDEIGRLAECAKIDLALKATKTNAISKQANIMSAIHVTKELRKAVVDELTGISDNGLKVTIQPKAVKGTTYHRVDIEGRKVDSVTVKEIVSEGEFRAIALAAFLAELGQSDDRSAIVVDDPVSSLDHMHRRRVAERLVAESAKRQVIILTHDLVFIDELNIAATERGVTCGFSYVKRERGQVGIVCNGLPWQGMTVKQRINELRGRIPELKKLHAAEEHHQYRLNAKDWYGDLRETWERAVEDHVLNKVVTRFSRSVKTSSLKEIAGCFTRDDYRIIDAGMTKTSRMLKGHDEPRGSNSPLPNPVEVEADLNALHEFIKDYDRRKNAN